MRRTPNLRALNLVGLGERLRNKRPAAPRSVGTHSRRNVDFSPLFERRFSGTNQVSHQAGFGSAQRLGRNVWVNDRARALNGTGYGAIVRGRRNDRRASPSTTPKTNRWALVSYDALASRYMGTLDSLEHGTVTKRGYSYASASVEQEQCEHRKQTVKPNERLAVRYRCAEQRCSNSRGHMH